MSITNIYDHATGVLLLAERVGQISRNELWLHNMFWEMSPSSAVETAAYLPALAMVVRKAKEHDTDLLAVLSCHPLPSMLPPGAVSWHDHLVSTWEVHRASGNDNRMEPAGEWGVASGEWGVASGEWGVASGEWGVASGEWGVA